MIETATYSESQILGMLHSAGIRPSVHRIAVLTYVANRKTHPTAEELYKAMAADYPSMSRTTVYNSLHVLVEAGLLRELVLESESTHYDLAPQPAHSHFVCTRCGRIFDMAMAEGLDTLVTPGFSVQSTNLHFKGLCPDCNKPT